MISIITPHFAGTNSFVMETYQSLLNQTLTDWEWVIVCNNGGVVNDAILSDERVTLVNSDISSVGHLKKIACTHSSGAIVVELDADDMLTPDALAEISDAFRDPRVSFVYSDYAEFWNKSWKPRTFDAYYGWKQYPFNFDGHELIAMKAFEPSPHSLRTIWWAPNHVRAWRAIEYWQIGGHNENMALADDHDLVCRFYIHFVMKRIDKCLYLYRLHGDNTCLTRAQEIQSAMWGNYARYIFPMAEKWARDNDFGMIDLGGAIGKPKGYHSIDIRSGADIVYDLNKGIPAIDNSIGVIRASDILEHLKDPVQIMNEAYRVLAPGGWLMISVPSTDGRGAFQDPTHVSFWNENSFWYYTNPKFARFVPDIKCKFQVSRVLTWFPSQWHKEHNIPYIDAQLIALKDGYEPIGESLWPS